MRPLLVDDYKYEEEPESLQNILKFIENSSFPFGKVEILVGLIYILMLESGFVPLGYKDNDKCDFDYQRVLQLSQSLPVVRRNKSYHVTLVLPAFPSYEVKLAIVIFSEDLLINCFVKGVERSLFNALLDPLTYFTSSDLCLQRYKFQSLNHLSRVIKDRICFPVKYCILKHHNILFPCLEDLPAEIIIIIMKKLKLCDLIRFGMTNKHFYGLMTELLEKIVKKIR
ncbi:uncharacterized protein LOC132703997 isoform X2 [Cylas formicarius]|nr:uncharacterized protein LOC132703997 isoform X2 [Cylas formicarius]XP_060529577.1 uncharacterized protein LOC132703997 isoform X2 [Cylas formicarius]